MQHPIFSKIQKVTACSMIFMLLLVVLFSTFYIAAENNHDCTGDDCPICICIRQCEAVLHQLGDGAAHQAILILPVFPLLFSIVFFSYTFTRETLVSMKIRLNH